MASTSLAPAGAQTQTKTMKVMQVSREGGEFELVERPIPKPGAQQVLIRVEACGVCHSDMYVKEGGRLPVTYPRVPGHEVVGVIEQIGDGVTHLKPGQRVGVGWHGGHDFTCDACRRGDFINCDNKQVTGLSLDGGYGEYMIARAEAVALMPEDLNAVEAAPLLCAGVTTFNSLRNSGARAGDLVAILGIGGLGHLAVQFSRQMGFKTVAVSGGSDKKQLALDLGAHFYIDSEAQNPAEALKQMGGAKVILATAPNSKVISSVADGLASNGKMMIVGATADGLDISPIQLINGRRGLQGWASGTAKDSEDTMNFSVLSGVRPMIEVYPLSKAQEAYTRMMENKARFRVVLKMNS